MKVEKLLAAIRNNPNDVRFGDFETALKASGFTLRRQKGSHAIWAHPQGGYLNIQNDDGKAKPYQIKQFLSILDEK